MSNRLAHRATCTHLDCWIRERWWEFARMKKEVQEGGRVGVEGFYISERKVSTGCRTKKAGGGRRAYSTRGSLGAFSWKEMQRYRGCQAGPSGTATSRLTRQRERAEARYCVQQKMLSRLPLLELGQAPTSPYYPAIRLRPQHNTAVQATDRTRVVPRIATAAIHLARRPAVWASEAAGNRTVGCAITTASPCMASLRRGRSRMAGQGPLTVLL